MLKNQGFSLLEVMATMAILGLTIFGISQLTSNASKSTKSNELSADAAVLISNIEAVLASADCTTMMTGHPFGPLPQSLVPLTVTNAAAVTTTIADIPLPPLPPGAQLTQLAITSILNSNITPAALPNITEQLVNVHIEVTKIMNQNANAVGGNIFAKDFPLSLWIDTGTATIIGCSPAMQNPAPLPTLTFTSVCQDTLTPVQFQVYVPNRGSAWVEVDTQANQTPYGPPAPTEVMPNPDFVEVPAGGHPNYSNPFVPAGLPAPAFPAIATPGTYNFYATAFNSSNQSSVSAASTVVVVASCAPLSLASGATCGEWNECYGVGCDPGCVAAQPAGLCGNCPTTHTCAQTLSYANCTGGGHWVDVCTCD